MVGNSHARRLPAGNKLENNQLDERKNLNEKILTQRKSCVLYVLDY